MHVSSFRATWRVPPEPTSRSGQTVFLFPAMQDPIPMTLLQPCSGDPRRPAGASTGGGKLVRRWHNRSRIPR